MKKIAVSASLMALSAASLHAVYAPELSRIETAKPWTVSASLRGFYDDNWATTPIKHGSWGMEARPYIALNLPMEQTFLGLSYLNSSRFYEARSRANLDPWDFTHEATLKFDHAFSPRTKLSLQDSFLYTQEPDIEPSGLITAPIRSRESMWRNSLSANVFERATDRVAVSLTYNNTVYNYLDHNEMVSGETIISYAALLNRMEHAIPVDVRWQVNPDLVGLVGYSFGLVNYTGNDVITVIPTVFRSDSRDAMSHTFFVGGTYDITAQLSASLRVGAQYSDYLNVSGANQFTPYVDGSLTYNYMVGSHADLGFRHTMSPTDVARATTSSPTMDMEATAAYLSISHQITGRMTGNALAQYQIGTFHGGAYDGQKEGILMLGLYVDYKVNPFLSLEAGYNFDWLDSDLMVRGYNRNRVYLGIRAHY